MIFENNQNGIRESWYDDENYQFEMDTKFLLEGIDEYLDNYGDRISDKLAKFLFNALQELKYKM